MKKPQAQEQHAAQKDGVREECKGGRAATRLVAHEHDVGAEVARLEPG